MKRLALLSAILTTGILTVTTPALARVLSYAPYSTHPAQAAIHERTSRRFVLIETVDPYNGTQQVVLYDTKGEEPRVVFQPGTAGSWSYVYAAALYERKNRPDLPPLLLVVAPNTSSITTTLLSSDGGATWTELTSLRGLSPNTSGSYDFGGPWTQGIANGIRIGNDEHPFVIGFGYGGVHAIHADGQTSLIDADPYSTIIGQDRGGNRLLLRSQSSIELVDLTAHTRRRLGRTQESAGYSGWITADGSAYLQVVHASGQFLYFQGTGPAELILGGYNQTPPAPLDSPWGYSYPYNGFNFFAVPTADFEGAWMLQKQYGKPTTLSRHTRPAGVQEMWRDVSGPEVEALIAGESGQTLLIQVHRDHSVQLQRPFIDPALAVWQVGQPAPRDYDELFLNEEWNKGFVHVDVDRMTAGEPFVFNSGSYEPSLEGPVSPPVGGGGDVVQEWGVVRASLRQHLVLPGVARLHGAFESRWLSDVTMFNPLDTPQEVVVRFVGLGEDVVESSLRQKTVTLDPHEIRFIPDVLHAIFGIEDGGGALHFLPASAINVVGRTYSQKPDNGGTFGFGMQAIDFYNSAGPRFPVTFAGAFPGDHFRTNILITDTSGFGTEASTNAYGVTGPMGSGAATIYAPPGGVLQFNALGSSLGLLSQNFGGLIVQPTRGTAITTVVAIDNRTNDATYFPPDIATTSLVRAIPVIGHLDGANGSHFRSDVYLFNPTNLPSTVTLEAKQWDTAAVKTLSFTLLPREARVIPDALPTLFQLSGLARLRYWTPDFGGGVRVTSRTYTVDDTGATYGSLIPPLNNFQVAAPGDKLEILGISGGSGFRTNLGLVELSPANGQPLETTIRVRVLNEKLTQLDTFTLTLPRAGGTQINDIFAARGIAAPEAAMLVVEVMNGGLLGAYATLTDNITNDSTYLGAQLGAQE
jgi:hypothetical protein